MKKIIFLSLIFCLFLISGCTTQEDLKTNTLVENENTASTSVASNNHASQLKPGKWLHAMEEDKDGVLTYKNDPEYKPLPSRFHGYFIYQEGGVCACLKASPSDAHYEATCPCLLTGQADKDFFTLDSVKYSVVKKTDTILLIKPVLTD